MSVRPRQMTVQMEICQKSLGVSRSRKILITPRFQIRVTVQKCGIDEGEWIIMDDVPDQSPPHPIRQQQKQSLIIKISEKDFRFSSTTGYKSEDTERLGKPEPFQTIWQIVSPDR